MSSSPSGRTVRVPSVRVPSTSIRINRIERARSEGLEVVKSVILVDRQEGGLENIGKYVDDVSRIISRDELIERWKELKLEADTD